MGHLGDSGKAVLWHESSEAKCGNGEPVPKRCLQIEENLPAGQLTFFQNIFQHLQHGHTWEHWKIMLNYRATTAKYCKALVAISPKEVNPLQPSPTLFLAWRGCVNPQRPRILQSCTARVHWSELLSELCVAVRVAELKTLKDAFLKDSTSRCWGKTKENDGSNFPRSSEMRLFRSFNDMKNH